VEYDEAARDVNEALRRKAFNNVMRSLDLTKTMPANVFSGVWPKFLFFESDRLFAPEFAEIVGEILSIEHGTACCLLNISETRTFEFEKIAAIFLDKTSDNSDYAAALRGTGPEVGWIYVMDRYGCASDTGEWCIYCEKDSDIAVIGFRSESGAMKFESPIEKLWANSIEAHESAKLIPFHILLPRWREGLIHNYVGVDPKDSSI
jgi:hypothetical protein